MNNIYFIILLFFLFSCIENKPIHRPELNVKPDTNVVISSISPVVFSIECFGHEELKSLKVETAPFVHKLDTNFRKYTHSTNQSVTISILDEVPGLGEDSIITTIFTLSDAFNSTVVSVSMRVVSDYPKLRTDTISLVFSQGGTMFYSAINALEFTYGQVDDIYLDLVMVYDSIHRFIIASPNAPYIVEHINSLGYEYTSSGKNITKINKILTDWNIVNEKFLYFLQINPVYINNKTPNGIGVSNLRVGNFLVFHTFTGRKGALNVLDIDTENKKITFVIKTQFF